MLYRLGSMFITPLTASAQAMHSAIPSLKPEAGAGSQHAPVCCCLRCCMTVLNLGFC